MDLRIRKYLFKAEENRDSACLRKAHELICASGQTDYDGMLQVQCAEISLELGCRRIAEDCLMRYWREKHDTSHFLCRALLVQARLTYTCQPTTAAQLDEAVVCCLKAVHIASSKSRYKFLVFNASVLYFHIVRFYLRPGRRCRLVSSLTQVVKALEKVQDPEFSWRAELMIELVKCLLDDGQEKEATTLAKATAEFIQSHNLELYPRLFTIQVRHTLTTVSKSVEKNKKLLVTYKLQKLKSELRVREQKDNGFAALNEIFQLLARSSPASKDTGVSRSSSALSQSTRDRLPGCGDITAADRLMFLLELAFLSLQLRQHSVASSCLQELRLADLTVCQSIMMECALCELELCKSGEKEESYSTSSVELQMSVMERLDALLRSMPREGRAIQAVCVSLWNTCLPLLQHHLRSRLRPALVSLAAALESSRSTMLDVLCQVHMELAAVEEEDGKLETAMKHLQKVVELDPWGLYSQKASVSLHFLQMSTSENEEDARPEERAAALIRQAKEAGGPRDGPRALLLRAGGALAPDAFLMLLDDKQSKGAETQNLVEQLAAKAQFHSVAAGTVAAHLDGLEPDSDSKERVKIWGSLVKTARKLEVFDVCEAAARLCLLYDDKRWEKAGEDSMDRDLLQLLAEIHLISAEVNVLKLRSEGLELNAPAEPPAEGGALSPEDHALWMLYSDWIKDLSADITKHLLRAAELGVELEEDWLVVNAAVDLWNYNRAVMTTRGREFLLPVFSRMVQLLRRSGHGGELVLLVQLCDTIAQGILQSEAAAVVSREPSSETKGDQKTKKGKGKTMERTTTPTHSPDVDTALEVCEYALHMTNGSTGPVPFLERKQLISTWLSIKQLIQQQIGPKLDIQDQPQNKNESSVAVSRVVVGVEMLRCNRTAAQSRLMQFTPPSLPELAHMAENCLWSNPVMEMYVWTQLALFAHQAKQQPLVRTCTHNALQLEQASAHGPQTRTPAVLRSVAEMLSCAACVSGQLPSSEVRDHLEMLLNSVRFANQAENWSLCMMAATHFWNACLPLLSSRRDRHQLREALQTVLKVLNQAHTRQTHVRKRVRKDLEDDWQRSTLPSSDAAGELTVWAALYNALFSILADLGEWRDGQQLLQQAEREMTRVLFPRVLLEQSIRVKARLGQCVQQDMLRFRDQDELVRSRMWRNVALSAKVKQHSLRYYQNAISTLKDSAGLWQKVDFLLELAEWLHQNDAPVSDVTMQIEQALDLLLFENQAEAPALSDLKEIWRLERLLRAQTMLSISESRTSPKHLEHLLVAYNLTLHIWRVSVATAQEPRSEDTAAPAEEKSKGVGKAVEIVLPIVPEQWIRFQCPEEVRQVFRCDTGSRCINRTSLGSLDRTLFYLDLLVKELESVALFPLTLAPLHLAEVIAHNLKECRSLSDIYRLRIIRNCSDLGFESPYRQELQTLAQIPEDDETWYKSIMAQASDRRPPETSLDEGRSSHLLWLEKADLCLSMNLHQPARVLLTHTQLIAEEVGDQTSLGKSLLLQAVLANQEQLFSEAVDLLRRAQDTAGDEDFWFRLVETLIFSVSRQNGPAARQQVHVITEEACGSFRALLEQCENRASVLSFFISALESRSAVLQRDLLGPDAPLCSLTALCDTFKRATSDLLQLGYRTHAAEVMLEHASTLRIMSNSAPTEEARQRHLLDALELLRMSVCLQEDVVLQIISILHHEVTPQSERCDLPAVRVSVRLRLDLADLSLCVMELQCEEQRRKTEELWSKSRLDRMVEDFISGGSDLSAHQQEWDRVGRSLAQGVLMQLTVVISLSHTCVESRARSLGMMGRCLRLMAQQKAPLYVSALWNRPIPRQATAEPEEEGEEDKQDRQTETTLCHDTIEQMDVRAAQQLLSQASETLAQAVSLCLRHNLPALLRDVCSNLLECHAQCDISATGQFLALLQSGVCCGEMWAAMRDVCGEVGASGLNALLNLRALLLSSPAPRPRGRLAGVEQELTTLSQACEHWSINPKHLGILGEMPENFKILLLQHSSDRRVLFAAFYEKVKAEETQKGKNITGGLVCSRLVKASVQPSALLNLRQRLQLWKDLQAQTLHHQPPLSPSVCCTETLEDVFRELLEDLEVYLRPAVSQLRLPTLSVRSTSDPEQNTAEEPNALVVLADADLLPLPVEALLQADASLSRDFSLQVLHWRLQTLLTVTAENESKKEAKKGAKAKSDQSRDMKADRPVSAEALEGQSFRYLVNFQAGERDGKLSDAAAHLRRSLQMFAAELCSGWESLTRDVQSSSVTDREQLLTSYGALLYCGIENFFSCFPADQLLNLNMSGCKMLCLLDCGLISPHMKKRISGWTEGPGVSARLMTLAGVQAVLLNLWPCSATANARVLRFLVKHLLTAGRTSGHCVHLLHSHQPGTEPTDEVPVDNKSDSPRKVSSRSSGLNVVLYGLPHLVVV